MSILEEIRRFATRRGRLGRLDEDLDDLLARIDGLLADVRAEAGHTAAERLRRALAAAVLGDDRRPLRRLCARLRRRRESDHAHRGDRGASVDRTAGV